MALSLLKQMEVTPSGRPSNRLSNIVNNWSVIQAHPEASKKHLELMGKEWKSKLHHRKMNPGPQDWQNCIILLSYRDLFCNILACSYSLLLVNKWSANMVNDKLSFNKFLINQWYVSSILTKFFKLDPTRFSSEVSRTYWIFLKSNVAQDITF